MLTKETKTKKIKTKQNRKFTDTLCLQNKTNQNKTVSVPTLQHLTTFHRFTAMALSL